MTDLLLRLLLVFVLVLVNAAFAGLELALVSLREGQLQRLEGQSRRGRIVAQLAREPSRFLATIQVGITLAGLLASASAAVSLAEPIEEQLGDFPAAGFLSIIVVTLALAYVTLVFGELAPKRIAMQRAERWALRGAPALAVLLRITRPVVWLLSKSTDLVVRLAGADPNLGREEVTEEEIRELVAGHDTITEAQRRILDGAFEIDERTLAEVLVPRRDVLVLDSTTPASAALAELVASGYSRAPVATGGDLDDVVGIVHLRQLVGVGDATVGTLVNEAFAVPESARVLDTLRRMQVERQHLAIVVSEYGGTEGIVTMEDILEELVGEIWDETDLDVATAVKHDDGSVTLPGRFPIHDLDDVGILLPSGNYATVAGLVLDRLGHLPEGPGEQVEVDGHLVEVTAVEGRTITEVRITPPAPADPDDDGDE